MKVTKKNHPQTMLSDDECHAVQLALQLALQLAFESRRKTSQENT